MNKLDKLFGQINMSWPRVVLFSLITGVYTGLVMMIPALKDTSFQDIGISYEWWVFFAVIIVTNCKKSYEAMLKCFVFFLISQPIVYAVEVIGGQIDLNHALIYYNNWLKPTLLTIPGGFIAFFCKKQNVLGAVILGLGNTIELLMFLYYIGEFTLHFPNHLLTALTCFAFIIIMTLGIQKKGNMRTIAFIVPVCLVAVGVIILRMLGLFVSNIFF